MPLWKLAVWTGASPSTVAAYARGARRASPEWIERAHSAMNVVEEEQGKVA